MQAESNYHLQTIVYCTLGSATRHFHQAEHDSVNKESSGEICNILSYILLPLSGSNFNVKVELVGVNILKSELNFIHVK